MPCTLFQKPGRFSFGGCALLAPLRELLAVHVVLDDARVVVPVGQVHRVRVHEHQERRPAEMRVVVARDVRRAERQQELLAVVRELVDAVSFGIDDPDVLLRSRRG